MKPFRFTLLAVQTVRQRLEENAIKAYSAALRAQLEARGRRDSVRRELESGWLFTQGQVASGATAVELTRTQDYCRLLEHRLQESETAVEAAQVELQKKWQELLLARRNREVVDKCYQNQRERYEHGLLVEEQKRLDDLANRRPMIRSQTSQRDPLWN